MRRWSTCLCVWPCNQLNRFWLRCSTTGRFMNFWGYGMHCSRWQIATTAHHGSNLERTPVSKEVVHMYAMVFSDAPELQKLPGHSSTEHFAAPASQHLLLFLPQLQVQRLALPHTVPLSFPSLPASVLLFVVPAPSTLPSFEFTQKKLTMVTSNGCIHMGHSVTQFLQLLASALIHS